MKVSRGQEGATDKQDVVLVGFIRRQDPSLPILWFDFLSGIKFCNFYPATEPW